MILHLSLLAGSVLKLASEEIQDILCFVPVRQYQVLASLPLVLAFFRPSLHIKVFRIRKRLLGEKSSTHADFSTSHYILGFPAQNIAVFNYLVSDHCRCFTLGASNLCLRVRISFTVISRTKAYHSICLSIHGNFLLPLLRCLAQHYYQGFLGEPSPLAWTV